MKKIYGIGVGPGDRELITLKGYKLIRSCNMVFIPESGGESLAEKIAGEYIQDKKVIRIEFPMGEDNAIRYEAAAEFIDCEMGDGEVGVFLTLGDPMVYSTFLYLMMELEKKDIEVESVPGITSFCASANRIKMPISLKGEKFYLCDGGIDEEILKSAQTVCILKTYKNKEDILNKLEKNDFRYVYIKRCSHKDEKVLEAKEEILKDKDYLSLILGRRQADD